jgi:Putative abortive phage resistance protein AbiGi, antitoxin
MHVHRLTGTIPGRSVELKGYGLVFAKDALIKRGACPAVYLNAKGTELKKYLLSRFRSDFKTIKSLRMLKQTQANHFKSIIGYYSLINIIASNYDFTWEREWRYSGSFRFKYHDIVAIVATDPESFESYYKKQLRDVRKYIDRIPIISPNYSYEEVVEAMSIKIWNAAVTHSE